MQQDLDGVPLRPNIAVKTGIPQRNPSIETKQASLGSGGAGPDSHAEILDIDGKPLRGLTRKPNVASADAGILDVDGRPLRGLARVGGAPAAPVKVADLLDVDGRPLPLRGRARVATAPSADADVLDIDGRPLRGRARRAQNGNASAPDPICGQQSETIDEFSEHLWSRRKPSAHAPDTLSIYDDSAVPPQYYASGQVAADFRGSSHVPMQSRRKVEGSPV
jgi:hypothetical protein